MVSLEYSEAIVEVLEILQNSDDDIIEKIPPQLMEFWQKNKSVIYKPVLNHDLALNEMNLKPKTKSLIAMIYMNYLCDDTEKNNIKLMLKSNEENYHKQLREEYTINNVGKEKNEEILTKQNDVNTSLIPKESLMKKIINKLKKILKREKIKRGRIKFYLFFVIVLFF